MKNTVLLTPRKDGGLNYDRLEMKITRSDQKKFDRLSRAQWTRVHDYVTDSDYLVRKASCGSSCFCDAVYRIPKFSGPILYLNIRTK